LVPSYSLPRYLFCLSMALLVSAALLSCMEVSPVEGPTPETVDAGEDDNSAFYTYIDTPGENLEFGTGISMVGDVNGDGFDDLMIGTNETFWGTNPQDERRNFLLLGREDRNFTWEGLVGIQNMSPFWYTPNGRWLGDVNGDGFDDIINQGASSQYSDPNWLSGNWLHVRYGSEDVEDLSQPRYLVTHPLDAPWYNENRSTNRIFPVGAGDVNGDGFNDACVVLYPQKFWGYDEIIPGGILLYYGSEDGLSRVYDFSIEIPYENASQWTKLGGVYFADVSGDGYDDMMVLTSNNYAESYVRIHYGSKDGLSKEPVRTIGTFDKPISNNPYYPTFKAPLDMDGDGIDDFLLASSSRKSQGVKDYNVRIYMGGNGTSALEPTQTLTLPKGTAGRVEAADINGDGLHDLVVIRSNETTWNQNGETIEGIDLDVYVRFNLGGRFGEEHDFSTTIKGLPMYAGDLKTDSGDFDGDGFEDLAITQYGHRDNGSLLLIYGGEIMGEMTCIDFEEGPVVYARHKAYDFVVDANPTGLSLLPSLVQLTLDPDGVAVSMECTLSTSGTQFREVDDPNDLVELVSGSTDLVMDDANGTAYLHFRVIFDWAWPHEEMCRANVRLTPQAGSSFDILSLGLFYVENDLELIGNAVGKGEWQGDLPPNGWVRSMENVTISGPRAVYQGTTDLHPPSGVCTMTATDNDGDSWDGPLLEGGAFEVTVRADETTDVAEVISLNLTELPLLSETTAGVTYQMRVDNDAPTFVNPIPDGINWHSVNEMLVSITAVDVNTSGPDHRTLLYTSSIGGVDSFGEWTTEGLATARREDAADGLVPLEFPDGDSNYIRWQIQYIVGDPATSEMFNIKVDSQNITFSDPVPTPGEWQLAFSVDCGVTIHDVEGSGIAVNTIEYRYSPNNLSQYTEWLDWNEGTQGDHQTISTLVNIQLVESAFNYVQWRAFDIAGNGITTSTHYKVSIDFTPISFSDMAPVDVLRIREVMCWASVTDGLLGSGVDLETIEYRIALDGTDWSEWQSAGMDGISVTNRFSVVVILAEGDRNSVQFRGFDVAGNGPTESGELRVIIDSMAPEIVLIGPDPEVRLTGTNLHISFSIQDDGGTGVDVENIWVRTGRQGPQGLGEWVKLTDVKGDTLVTVELELELIPGPGNIVQLKASDMVGNEAIGDEYSFHVNRQPMAVIVLPVDGDEFTTDGSIVLDGSDSNDPDSDELLATWSLENGSWSFDGINTTVTIEEGTHFLTLTVLDPFGGYDSVSVTIHVEHIELNLQSPDGIMSPLLLVLLLVIALVTGVGYYILRNQRKP